MKFKSIYSHSASLAALLFAGNAAALVPSDSNTADVKIFIAGSSVLDDLLTQMIKEEICNGDLITMSNGAVAPGTAQTAFVCTVNGAQVPALAGQKLVIYKRSVGGSYFAVVPVLNPDPSATVARLDPNSCPAAPVDATASIKHYNCGSTTVNDTPIAGISDVEPNLFIGPNQKVSLPEESFAPTNPSLVDDGGFTASALRATGYGIEVTTNLRNALQDAQIAIGKLPTGCIGNETEACMPSLSKAEIASIFGGSIASWDKFRVGTQPLTAFGTPGTNAKINACRFSPGSGVQAQYNALFHNTPCNSSASAPLRDNTSFTWRIANQGLGPAQHNSIGTNTGMNGVPTTAPAIHEGQGVGDVERCMELLNNSTVTRWGIGINAINRGQGNNGLPLPTDPNNPNAGAKDYLRFIKIDGVAPTAENIANSSYYDWAGITLQWRTSPYAYGVNNVPDTNQLVILQKIRASAVSPSRLAQVPIELPAGADYEVSDLAFPTASYAPSFPFLISNPIMTTQRGASGKPNSCATATAIGEIGL